MLKEPLLPLPGRLLIESDLIRLRADRPSIIFLAATRLLMILATREDLRAPSWRVQIIIDGERVTYASAAILVDIFGEALFDGN